MNSVIWILVFISNGVLHSSGPYTLEECYKRVDWERRTGDPSPICINSQLPNFNTK